MIWWILMGNVATILILWVIVSYVLFMLDDPRPIE